MGKLVFFPTLKSEWFKFRRKMSLVAIAYTYQWKREIAGTLHDAPVASTLLSDGWNLSVFR